MSEADSEFVRQPSRINREYLFEREWSDLEELREDWEWEIPEKVNMAYYMCDRWAENRTDVALIAEDPGGGNERSYTYFQMQTLANRLANYLSEQGIERGDRVGIFLPQQAETIITHLAIWKLGAVSVPLSLLFGPSALSYRLGDSEAKACIIGEQGLDTIRPVLSDLDDLETVLTVGDVDTADGEDEFYDALEDHSREFDTVVTDAEDPAMIVYTSGTTGDPKGTVLAHRYLLAYAPSHAEIFCDMKEPEVSWVPAPFAWVVIYMAFGVLYWGKPLVTYQMPGEFDADYLLSVIEKHRITNFVGVPTMLRLLDDQIDDPSEYDVQHVKAILSGSERAEQRLAGVVERIFGDGTPVNEAGGQTEALHFVGGCEALNAPSVRRRRVGPALAGHDPELLDPETKEVIDEQVAKGELAIPADDPLTFEEYWNKPEKTANKIRNGFVRMEDVYERDEAGDYEFVTRLDDVIICSGYRIGPGEIEKELANHEMVLDAGVIGIPDDKRGEVPMAFVEVANRAEPGDDLEAELQEHVKDNLAKYEYPREIEFVDELPRTPSGKIQRYKLREQR